MIDVQSRSSRGDYVRTIFSIVVLACIVVAPVSAADSPGQLVKKLGNPSFKIRSEAGNELARLGPNAITALTEGTKNADTEIAEQCKKILDRVEADEQQRKLAALLRDPEAAPPKGLAGAEQFFKVTGDSKAARELYVGLMREFHEMIMAREKNPNTAADSFFRYGETMKERVSKILKTAKSKEEGMVFSEPEITLLFVFAADNRVNQARRHHIFQNMLVINKYVKYVKAALSEGPHAPVMRKLFVNWLFNEPLDIYQQAGFELAADMKLSEVLPESLKLIQDKVAPAKRKALAMLGMIQVGTREHVKILTPFLVDKTLVYTANPGGIAIDVLLRDVAMGVSLQLAGEKLDDYGLGDRRFGVGRGVSKCLYYYGFPDKDSRDKAHTKWGQWVAKHPEIAAAK